MAEQKIPVTMAVTMVVTIHPIMAVDATTDPEATMVGDIILRPTTVMAIWTAEIPTDMPPDPERRQAVPREAQVAIPGTEVVALHLLQLPV